MCGEIKEAIQVHYYLSIEKRKKNFYDLSSSFIFETIYIKF